MPDCPGRGAAELQRTDVPILEGYRIVSVAPYSEQQTHIKRTWSELRGATVRVQAQPGLTPEWLQLELERRVATLATGAATDDSPLAVPGVKTSVSPAADGFDVRLVAPDKRSAEEVLRRAEALQARAEQ